MHDSVLKFVEAAVAAEHFTDRTVLEVGSYNVNGSARDLIAPVAKAYLGVDLVPGPGVDQVRDGEALPAGWGWSFGATVCTEALEHAMRPWRVVDELIRVLMHGSVALITVRGFNESGAFPFHNPPDRWRVSVDGMVAMVTDAGAQVLEVASDPQAPGVFCLARKP